MGGVGGGKGGCVVWGEARRPSEWRRDSRGGVWGRAVGGSGILPRAWSMRVKSWGPKRAGREWRGRLRSWPTVSMPRGWGGARASSSMRNEATGGGGGAGRVWASPGRRVRVGALWAGGQGGAGVGGVGGVGGGGGLGG